MRYAIIADIHGNLEALQRVLADAKKMNCTHYACLGDVVGYNANPKECLDIIRDMGMPCVKGNHDEYCSVDAALEGFNPHAAEAVNWTRSQLTEEDILWLRELRYIRLVANFTIVHATLDGPKRWGYVFDKLAAAASFTSASTALKAEKSTGSRDQRGPAGAAGAGACFPLLPSAEGAPPPGLGAPPWRCGLFGLPAARLPLALRRWPGCC